MTRPSFGSLFKICSTTKVSCCDHLGKSEHDSVFLLETLKVLTKGAPFMLAEELQTLALKPSLAFPFAAITFLEPYLDKTVQKEYSIPEHTMYACFEDLLVKIKEKDLVLGFRKTFLEKDRDKNMLTMLQLRDYHSAEDLCMEAFKDAEIKLPTADSLNEEIHKLILEETWIEIAKNMNDWSELYSISEGSERKDLLLEASFFTGNMEKVEEMFRKYPDEDNTTNCIYYALAILAKDYPHIDQFDNEAVRKFKEKICLMLMKDWFYLPRVFGENHIHQIALSHFWAEFEEGFDILQELRTKRVQNPNYPAHLLKLKEDVTFINMIRRQRLPNEADGLVNCKKIMEQRSVLSHILHSKIKNFIDSLAASPNPLTHFINSNIGDENRYNIFNETLHDAVMYAKIERSYGIYNSIQNICPIIDEKIKQNSIPTQTDEFYYYHEKIKFWTADEENKLPPQNILEKLDEANLVFNKDFKSDLHSTIMRGYLEKGMLEQANKHGIESLKLNEANWKLWTNWFNFYKRAYHQYINTDRSLVYFIEMIKAYGKAIKYKPAQNLILFSEILNILYFRDDLVKSKSKDEEELKARVADAFNDMMKKTPVWTWTAWMGNLIQSVYKKNSFGLDKIIIERLDLASQMYRPFIHYILNSFLGTTSLSGKKDKDLEEILEKCKTYPIGNIKLQDLSVSQLISLYNSEELGNKNRYAERISIVYGGTIESKTANMLMAECKEICDDYNILKNQDLTVKLTNIINIIDQYLGPQKSLINNRTPELNLKGSAIGARFSLLNTSSIYNDRSLTDFFSEGYLLPDIKVVYEARRFSLQVEFSTLGQKKMIYTLRKDITINSSHLMSYNHYLKLMNVEMLRNNETVFRNLRFTPLETQYLEEDYFLKAKTPSEINLIDVLDSEIERLGLKVDHVLENFVVKKQPWEINKPMTEMVSKKIFKQEILKKLKSEYELFLWKKRFAQSLGVNAVNTILFAKGNFRVTRQQLREDESRCQ
jgi:hypothetical protein